MPLYQKLPENLDEVDIIIAGGGSAGCVVAGRLAAADPGLSILLIEQGRNNYDLPSVIHPALFAQNLVPATGTALFYQANKAKELNGRKPIVPSGGILGGGSSINFMLYTRGQRSDYDAWNMPGWSTDELLPFFKRLETYHGDGHPQTHGFSGPIHVSDGTHRSPVVMNEVLAAAKAVGYPEIHDLQDFDANNGFGTWYRTVCPSGRRQDAAHTFIHPLLESNTHPNLHVLVEHLVIRVLLDNNNDATGIELTPKPAHQPILSGTAHPTHTINARKLVIISSGALGSPAILERSGIGCPTVLSAANIPLRIPLPGVGHAYQDHNLVLHTYKTSLSPSETLDEILTCPSPLTAPSKTMLGWNGCDIASKLRPSPSAITSLGPVFQAAWDRDFASAPDKPLMLTAVLAGCLTDPAVPRPGQYVTVGNYTAYPYSRGHIHVTGPGLDDRLDFNLGFFTDADEIDIMKLQWAYKNSREIMRRTTFYRGELANSHPTFRVGSKAALITTDAALFEGDRRQDVVDIEYDTDDDLAIEDFLREKTETTWHSLGTNKMAPRKDMGVVDADLNVYGTTGLKVVDLSIAPGNVGANTNNTALVIGEKGADIIAGELGLALSPCGRLGLGQART
ncbi:hypothetical protein OQA88_4303 [Cercophora sp. LCS_1]